MRNMEELQVMFDDAKKELVRLGYDLPKSTIALNGRLKTCFGRCFTRRHLIEVSKNHFLYDSYNDVMNTIIHELIHDIASNSFNSKGHDLAWKKIARHVTKDNRFNVKIAIFGDDSQHSNEFKKATYKYTVKCPICNLEWKRTRKCDLTDNPSRYNCPYCGKQHEENKKLQVIVNK